MQHAVLKSWYTLCFVFTFWTILNYNYIFTQNVPINQEVTVQTICTTAAADAATTTNTTTTNQHIQKVWTQVESPGTFRIIAEAGFSKAGRPSCCPTNSTTALKEFTAYNPVVHLQAVSNMNDIQGT